MRYLWSIVWLVLQMGCTHSLQQEPMPQEGQRSLKLKEDCYVIRFINGKNPEPQIAGVLPIAGMTMQGFPNEVSDRHIGRRFGDATILGILLKGTVLVVESVKTEKSFEIGALQSPVVRPVGPASKVWPLLDAIWISDRANRRRIHPA